MKLLKTHQLTKRPIDQVGVLGVSGQIVILSGKFPHAVKDCQLMVDTVVTVCPADFGKGIITLTAAKTAHTFAITAYTPSTSGKGEITAGQESRKDLIVVGCRKKVVVYGAGKTLRDPWVCHPHPPL